MNKLILATLLVSPGLFGQTKPMNISFPKAHQSKMIRFEAEKCNGGLLLSLSSKSRKPIKLSFEAGLTFIPDDTLVQPGVLVHPRWVALAPGEKRTIMLETACGNAHKSGRSKAPKTTFSSFKDGALPLKNMLDLLSQRGWTEQVSIQKIVWVFTNSINIAGALDSRLSPEAQKVLVDTLCALSGKKEPNYRLKYQEQEDPNGLAFTAKADWISGKFEYTLNTASEVHLVLQDSHQNLVRTYMTLPKQSPGAYRFPFKLDLYEIPAGDYSLCILGHGKVLQALPFTI